MAVVHCSCCGRTMFGVDGQSCSECAEGHFDGQEHFMRGAESDTSSNARPDTDQAVTNWPDTTAPPTP